MTTVAYQGVSGANSEIAVLGYFPDGVIPLPCQTFAALFDAVVSSQAEFGVVPIENSLAGSVIDNYDLLIKQPVHIIGELYLHIRYQLFALPGVGLMDIRRVYSHPQALAQCTDYLLAHPQMQPEAAFDTAGAAKLVADRALRDSAAIAPRRAGERYGLQSRASDIQSNNENYTRMVIISKKRQQPPAQAQVTKTSVIAGLRHEGGSLATLLGLLHGAGMNLTKIESRPIVGRPWEYLFYLDWEGTLSEHELVQAKRSTTWWKDLGAYPRGQKMLSP